MTSWDLRYQFGNKQSTSNSGSNAAKGVNNRVCYRNLAMGIYGPAAPICVISWNTPCSHTALLRAYSDFIIRGMNLQSYSHYASKSPSKTITITYMARRASSVWPEKKYCDDKNSFFKCELWKDFGVRSLGRMVRNDADMVNTLISTFSTTSNSGVSNNNAKDLIYSLLGRKDIEVITRDVDYNLLTFEEQIKVDLTTDIMVSK